MTDRPTTELMVTPAEELAEYRTVTALTLAYDGALFSGFATQPGAETVQGCLEDALAIACRREVAIVGAGRTDSGVHALGQVVSFPSAHADPRGIALLRSINALAGPGISVSEVRYATGRFSARFDAVSREYRYRVANGPVPPLFLRHVAWWVKKPLDTEVMREAASVLIGEHDFRSFCVADSAKGKRTVRNLREVEILEEEHLGELCVVVRIVGNAFLHSMVRTIVGSLVEVGVGRQPVSWMGETLAAQARAVAGPSAPALGLTLWRVEYPPHFWSVD